MHTIRPTAVAGRFYPSDTAVLLQQVNEFLDTIVSNPTVKIPKAVIAPHAGYIYSGPIAGSAYQSLQGRCSHIKRVVLIGPAHTMRIRGLATVSVAFFASPLGNVTVDQQAIEKAITLPQVQVKDAAHAQEHGLEVHLPFLQTILSTFKIVPFVVGEATGEEVAEVLSLLWGSDETLIVVSSDLSHFYDYETAVKLDAKTAHNIVNLQPNRLEHGSACGRLPIQGLLQLTQRYRLMAHQLDLRNSGDTAGTKDRVVGYGAFAFTPK